MRIAGLQKLTLLDYPGKVACTVFTPGCNFCCPFCHNADLVLGEEDPAWGTTAEEILDFLRKRRKVLEGVCVTGGEPLVQEGLEPFLREVKGLGYPIKLDTNGFFPERMKRLAEEGLVDYVAMDIKNSRKKYAVTAGVENLSLEPIEASVSWLLGGSLPYEFRTTVVQELHTGEDIRSIGEWIAGAKRCYLQEYEGRRRQIVGELQGGPPLHACGKEEMDAYREILLQTVEQVEIRGI